MRAWIRVNIVEQSRSSMLPGDDCRTTLFDIGNAAPHHITRYPSDRLKSTKKKKRHRKLGHFSFRVTGPCNLLGGYRDYPLEHTVSKFKWPLIIDPKCSSKTFTATYQINFLGSKGSRCAGLTTPPPTRAECFGI